MRVVQDQFLIGVTGIIFNEKREVLLFKHSYRQTVWSLPGGYLKSGENFLAAIFLPAPKSPNTAFFPLKTFL